MPQHTEGRFWPIQCALAWYFRDELPQNWWIHKLQADFDFYDWSCTFALLSCHACIRKAMVEKSSKESTRGRSLSSYKTIEWESQRQEHFFYANKVLNESSKKIFATDNFN